MVSNNKKRPETWGKRFALNLKTTEDIRHKVEERAKKSGRSITLEVEHQLIKSFEIEERDALNDEIKAEMRGTIAALEARISFMEEGDKLLWPDDSTHALGKAFAMTLTAFRHATGQGWRESKTAAPIIAGVVRRMIEECGRGSSIYAEMFERERIAATTEAIARSVVDGLREKLPPLPPLQPEDDSANWTNLAHLVVVFRDKTTGETLETIRSAEYDATAPEGPPSFGPEYRAALDRFRPIRETIEAEDFIVRKLKDGSSVWDSRTNPGSRTVVRMATPDEIAGMVPARGQLPPEIGDRALFDETMGPKRPDDGDEPPPAPPPAPSRRRKAKAST